MTTDYTWLGMLDPNTQVTEMLRSAGFYIYIKFSQQAWIFLFSFIKFIHTLEKASDE